MNHRHARHVPMWTAYAYCPRPPCAALHLHNKHASPWCVDPPGIKSSNPAATPARASRWPASTPAETHVPLPKLRLCLPTNQHPCATPLVTGDRHQSPATTSGCTNYSRMPSKGHGQGGAPHTACTAHQRPPQTNRDPRPGCPAKQMACPPPPPRTHTLPALHTESPQTKQDPTCPCSAP